jgi:hypothetical protein
VRHQVSAVTFEGGRLVLDLPIAKFALLSFVGTFARIATLGAAGPVIDERMMRLIVAHLRIDGAYPPQQAERAAAAPALSAARGRSFWRVPVSRPVIATQKWLRVRARRLMRARYWRGLWRPVDAHLRGERWRVRSPEVAKV